jgi:hypothetical protein
MYLFLFLINSNLLKPFIMKTVTFLSKTMICFFIGFFTLSLSAQTVITIDNGPQSNTTHKTLQAAIDAASDNDIIYIQPSGTSYGAGTIDKPLTIIGRSHSELSNVSSVSSLNIKASNVSVKGLSTSGLSIGSQVPSTPITDIEIFECRTTSITFGSGYSAAQTTIDGVTLRGCIIGSTITQYADSKNIVILNNIILSSTNIYGPSTLVLSNNIFRSSSNINITNNSSGETLIIYNNMFIANSGSDRVVTLSGNAANDFNVSNCLTYNYGAGEFNFTSSNSTFQVNNALENTNPLFTNVDAEVSRSMAGTSSYLPTARLEDDLTFQAGSPALTAGGGGSELGVFANGFNFKYLGNPRGVPVLDIITYDGAVPKNGNINVTISAKAH